jgi:cardiolipin synthase
MTDFIGGNEIVLLRNGTEYFPALEQAIDAAYAEVHLQTYIYEDDVVGQRIAAALIRAAQRGVMVCLLLDGFGCKDLSRSFVERLQQAEVDVLFYRPKISPWTLKRNRLRRLHRKIAVIDGQAAFVGGINIIDDMNTPGHTPPRVDYAVRIAGPLVTAIHTNARYLWRRIAWAHLRRVKPRRMTPVPQVSGDVWAAYVMRDNVLHRHDIEEAYLGAIESAQREIVIANAYFLPGKPLRHALTSAAKRGVRVVLLLQVHVEYWMLDHASRALYQQFLDAGIEIWEYRTSFMHSKVAVIDDCWATVGSSNIDPISLWLAREANVVIDDVGFAAVLRADLERALHEDALQLLKQDWASVGIASRALAWMTYYAVRLAMGIVGVPDKVGESTK